MTDKVNKMNDAGSGWIEPEPIELLRNPALQRPPTWLSVPRPNDVMWLDKNENLDPQLLRFNRSLLERVDARSLSVYPEAARLYSAIAGWCGVAPESLMLTPGSDGAIRLVFHAFVERGQQVVHTRPTFAMYPVYASIFGATASPLEYRRAPGGPLLAVDDVVAHLETVRPRLFCLPNPDSPTGTVFDPDEMSRLVDVCGRIGTVFLIDEAYHPFYRHSMVPRVASLPHVVVARSFSKAWGLAGLRLGYLVGHPRTIGTIHKLRPMYEVGALSIALMEIAIENGAEDIINNGDHFELRCPITEFDSLSSALEKAGIQPDSSELAYIPGSVTPVTETTLWGVWVHHPLLGIKLKEAMDELGMENYLEYRDGPPIEEYESQYDFIIQKLTPPPGSTTDR